MREDLDELLMGEGEVGPGLMRHLLADAGDALGAVLGFRLALDVKSVSDEGGDVGASLVSDSPSAMMQCVARVHLNRSAPPTERMLTAVVFFFAAGERIRARKGDFLAMRYVGSSWVLLGWEHDEFGEWEDVLPMTSDESEPE